MLRFDFCCVLSCLMLRFDFCLAVSCLILCFVLTFVLPCLVFHFDFCLAVSCLASCFILTFVLLCLVLLCLVLSRAETNCCVNHAWPCVSSGPGSQRQGVAVRTQPSQLRPQRHCHVQPGHSLCGDRRLLVCNSSPSQKVCRRGTKF